MAEKLALEKLMEKVGCAKYPARWADIFDTAMEEYNKNGCFLVKEEFYDNLNAKYGCFEEYGDVYKNAAKLAAKDEMLSRFLILLSMALNDKEHKKEDLKEFKRPTTPEGKDPAAYEMATGLAMCSQLESAAESLRLLGIPQKYINGVMRNAVNGTRNYIWRHNGAPGFDLLDWAQYYVEGRLFPINRLEMELFAKFGARAVVFQNKAGEIAVLAEDLAVHRSGYALGSTHCEDEEGSWTAYVEEDEKNWIGYPYREDGRVDKDKINLGKAEWEKVLEKGDPVVSVHIPATGKLTRELIDQTVEETREFLRTYYPEWKYKAFVCFSWLMSAQLDELLGPDTNIVKFSRMFRRLTRKSKGQDVFSFVFLKPDMNFDIKDLPENSSLERALKKLYLDGKALYEMYGFFF